MKKVTPRVEDYRENGLMVGTTVKGKKEPIKTYPRLRLEHEFFPEVKDWKVGETYKIELEVKMTGLSISKFSNDSEFDITGYEVESDDEENSENE